MTSPGPRSTGAPAGARASGQAGADLGPRVEPTSVQAPAISPRVTFEPEIGTAYISLAEPGDDLVATSVKLWPVDDQPAALSSLVLDFDAAGRMIGIKILKPADRVLRTGLLDYPATHASAPEEPDA